MLEVTFTVEPFVAGQPGAHVLAAVDAVRAAGPEVEFGPFGSSFSVEPGAVGRVVGELLDAAYANGATHVSLQIDGSDV